MAFYASYLATYLERDVRALTNVGSLRDFERFLRACALLNIRTPDELRRSPSAGAVWETFVFAQLRHRERMAGRTHNLFFWGDRRREVDFVIDAAGRVELAEARWTELPSRSDAANLAFLRETIGPDRVASAAIVCRPPNGYPLLPGIGVKTIDELITPGVIVFPFMSVWSVPY